jgi:prolipoprotein diacylglyceryltransferase
MTIPFEPKLWGISINIHLVMEYTAFILGFRYYVHLKKRSHDTISKTNRLSILVGAIFGAYFGSRLMGYLENPLTSINAEQLIELLNTKTIMGGLFGGLIGVESAKKLIGEKQSSGDLFVFPLILAIIIGRMGCFLTGVHEFTYGTETTFFAGMDLGDGILRHPIALYEILFLIGLWVVLHQVKRKLQKESGLLFKTFMLSYFGFRFGIEFIKPNVFYLFGLSSIQWLCILCYLYYIKTLKSVVNYAY